MDIKSIRMKYRRKGFTPLVPKLPDATEEEQELYELGLKAVERLYDVMHSAGCYHFQFVYLAPKPGGRTYATSTGDEGDIILSQEDSDHRSRPERAVEACRAAGYQVGDLQKQRGGQYANRYSFYIADVYEVAKRS